MKINQGVIEQVLQEKQQYGDAALIDIHKRCFFLSFCQIKTQIFAQGEACVCLTKLS